MQIIGLAQKVTIYIGESDKWQHQPLHTAILEMLRQEDCAGATVTRAVAGFGAHSRIRTASLVALSADLPLVIEWVDNPARVSRVMPQLRRMVGEGLITVQEVEVVAYHHRALRQLSAGLTVQDIMSREVHAVWTDTPLVEAIELLLGKIYRALPVVNTQQQIVGILTEGDLLDKTNLPVAGIQRALTQAEMAAGFQRLRQAGQSVADIMTPDPITISHHALIPEAVGEMLTHTIKRLPVVDDDKKLVGMISRVDVLRALSQPPVSETPRFSPPSGRQRQVATVMMTNVPEVQTDVSLAEIVSLLVSSAQRRVVVVNETRQVVGIITDGDLIKRATAAERSGILASFNRRLPVSQDDAFHLTRRTAAEVMTAPVLTVKPDALPSEALQLLLTHKIKRLPVVNDTGQLVGLVGRAGILQAIGQDYA